MKNDKLLSDGIKELDEILKEESKEMSTKATSTAFILMYPSVILTAIVIWYSEIAMGILALSLGIYQFLMLKKFIEDYYRK